MHFRLLKFKKGVNEFKYVALGTAIKVNSMLFNPKDKTIRDFPKLKTTAKSVQTSAEV